MIPMKKILVHSSILAFGCSAVLYLVIGMFEGPDSGSKRSKLLDRKSRTYSQDASRHARDDR